MRYSEEVIDEVRHENDIVSLISSYIMIKQKGNLYTGLCPFHNEKTPSFTVNPDKQYYYCFGCNASGNSISFVMAYENLDFISAIKFLAERVNYKLPEDVSDPNYQKNKENKVKIYEIHINAARFYYEYLNCSEGKVCYDYLINREILPNTIKRFGLGYSPKKWDGLYNFLKSKYDDELLVLSGLIIKSKNSKGYFDRFSNRLMFPIFDVFGKVVGFGGRLIDDSQGAKYLNSPETPIFDKSKNLYAINFAKKAKAKDLILVEGYMDVISLHQVGINNAVASLGTSFNKKHVGILKKNGFSKATLLFDSDQAGAKAVLNAIEVLTSNGIEIKVLRLNDAKDPDEYIKKFGLEKFLDVMSKSSDPITFKIDNISKNYDLSQAQQKSSFVKEVTNLLVALDDIDKSIYLKEIEKLTGISSNLVAGSLNTDNNSEDVPKTFNNPASSVDKMKKGLILSQNYLVYIISNNHNVYKSVKDHLKPEEFAQDFYKNVISTLYNLHNNSLDTSISALMTHFTDKEQRKQLINIFNNQIDYTTHRELEKAVNDNIKVIKEYNLEVSRINATIDLSTYALNKKNLRYLNITVIDG